ncbi:MAG: DUF2786 domain-containing protein [Woeseiaceae bacterium]
MKNNKKIIDKICKCLRLSESGNPNEAALALDHATRLMKKHDISNEQIISAEVRECSTEVSERYTPPFWSLALANLVAEAFQCRNLISRQYGRKTEYRFIGLGYKTTVASYCYTILQRHLRHAIKDFESISTNKTENEALKSHKMEVFAQAWLFRVGRTVSEFVAKKADKKIIDDYIEEKYGDTVSFTSEAQDTNVADYDDILSGMKAAEEVSLYRAMGSYAKPLAIPHKHAS